MAHTNWNCPKCHKQNISGELFMCPSCGKKRNRWGYWDCRYCGAKMIRADHKECVSCGHAKDRDVKFYLTDSCPVEFVDEVSGEAAVRIGRQNWICPYCMQQNDDAHNVCAYCGAARAESKESYHDIPNPNPQTAHVPMQNRPQQQRSNTSKPRVKRPRQKTNGCCLAMVLAFILGIAAMILLVFYEDKEAQKIRTASVDKAYWESTIFVEELRTFNEDDWEMPEGARLKYEREEDYTYIDHYEQHSRQVWVDDYDDDDDWGGGGWDDGGGDWGGGYDDYGDGQFGMILLPGLQAASCAAGESVKVVPLHYETEYYDVPVYATKKRTKYYYEIDRWVDARQVTEKGDTNTEPYYGELTLGEKERERERKTEYYVYFTYKDKTQYASISEEQWAEIRKNEEVRFHILDIVTSPTYELVFDNGQTVRCGESENMFQDAVQTVKREELDLDLD